MASQRDLWDRYRNLLCVVPEAGLTLDVSRMGFDESIFERLGPAMKEAFASMDRLEAGTIANPDEERMVGHYWLRDPKLAPDDEIRREIEQTRADIRAFAARVHEGIIAPPGAGADPARFTDVLSIGIGGSALGPMFVADALGRGANDRMRVHFIDNTDPDGIERTLASLAGRLGHTLTIVISKSGGTPETRNAMLVAQHAYRDAGLDFARHAVAVTGEGSKLDQTAQREGWLARFPMWDWVGGRTSETSAVGLLPAALQGIDIDALLEGAASCDRATRVHDARANPAALMALAWHHATGGRGEKDMVVLPYKDRLLLFSRYLQQLVMESLGKRENLAGDVVEQGVSVYGNKGSTDQHAYVQQLRDGINNFFVTFIRVLRDGGAGVEVEPGVTSGDYLHSFYLGTRSALFENGRASMTLTIDRVDARSVGVLIALFERAVGLYASLVGVNAYHQPGVEAGKKAAGAALELQASVVSALSGEPRNASEIAEAIGRPEDAEAIFAILEHLGANGRARSAGGRGPDEATFRTS